MGLLSLAIWLPIIAGVALLAFGRDSHAGAVRWAALLASLAGFLVTLPLITGFDTGTAAMQFQETAPWPSGSPCASWSCAGGGNGLSRKRSGPWNTRKYIRNE